VVASGFAIAKAVAVPCELERRNNQPLACSAYSQARPLARKPVPPHSLVVFTAIRRASSLVSNSAAESPRWKQASTGPMTKLFGLLQRCYSVTERFYPKCMLLD
jgi:hypothetical protein